MKQKKQKSKTLYQSSIGLKIYVDEYLNKCVITGFPKAKYTIREFKNAYEFQKFILDKIQIPMVHSEVEMDSEDSTFFAYTDNLGSAKRFITILENYFLNVQNLLYDTI